MFDPIYGSASSVSTRTLAFKSHDVHINHLAYKQIVAASSNYDSTLSISHAPIRRDSIEKAEAGSRHLAWRLVIFPRNLLHRHDLSNY